MERNLVTYNMLFFFHRGKVCLIFSLPPGVKEPSTSKVFVVVVPVAVFLMLL